MPRSVCSGSHSSSCSQSGRRASNRPLFIGVAAAAVLLAFTQISIRSPIAQQFDLDASFTLDERELRQALVQLTGHHSETDTTGTLSDADSDRDGLLSFEEFEEAVQTLNSEPWRAVAASLSGEVPTAPEPTVTAPPVAQIPSHEPLVATESTGLVWVPLLPGCVCWVCGVACWPVVGLVGIFAAAAVGPLLHPGTLRFACSVLGSCGCLLVLFRNRVLPLLILSQLQLDHELQQALWSWKRRRCLEGAHGVKMRECRFRTADGLELEGMTLESPAQQGLPPNQQRWVVWLPGFGVFFEQGCGLCSEAHLLYCKHTGCNVLLFNYRGAGSNQNSLPLCDRHLQLDAEAALRHLITELGVTPEWVLCHGHSIGGAVAVLVRQAEARNGIVSGPTLVDRSFSRFSAVVAEGTSQTMLGCGLGAAALGGLACVVACLYALSSGAAGSPLLLLYVVFCGMLGGVFGGVGALSWVFGHAATLFGWTLDAAEGWPELNDRKAILFHREDEVVPYICSLQAAVGSRAALELSEFCEDVHSGALHEWGEWGRVVQLVRYLLDFPEAAAEAQARPALAEAKVGEVLGDRHELGESDVLGEPMATGTASPGERRRARARARARAEEPSALESS